MSTTLNCNQRKVPGLETAVRKIDQISTLPHIALKVMEVANDPDSGAMDLKEAMECDPALSTRVLRCVNSSRYGVRHQITSLAQAILGRPIQEHRYTR